MELHEINAWRIQRLRAMAEKEGGNAPLGRKLGFRDGAYVGQMLRGDRPITEKMVTTIHRMPGYAGWFTPTEGPAGWLNVSPAQYGTQRVPVINYIQAGAWREIVDNFRPADAEDWLVTDLQISPNAFALEIVGNSMEPEFKEGDKVVIDPEVSPRPGDYVAARNGSQEATFKKYRPRGVSPGGVTVFELVPLNDDYPVLNSADQTINIVGTMVEHRRYRPRK